MLGKLFFEEQKCSFIMNLFVGNRDKVLNSPMEWRLLVRDYLGLAFSSLQNNSAKSIKAVGENSTEFCAANQVCHKD